MNHHFCIPAAGCLWLLAAIGAAAPAFGQAPPSHPSPSLLAEVVPNPTGKNGYEVLIAAADAFRASPYFEKAQAADTTLAFKRAVLADPQVARALKLLRAGLELPVTSPRETVTSSTTFPEMAGFRSLGRLLALQQYVELADGRVPDALATARLGLKFSQAIQTDTLLSGLVRIAISTLCLQPLGHHLDQLSVEDCATLYQICLEWLAQPDPQIRALAAEAQADKNAVEDLRLQVRQQGRLTQQNLEGMASDEEIQTVLKELPAAPDAADAFLVEVEKQVEGRFQRAIDELQKMPWERQWTETSPTELAARVASWLTPSWSHVDDAYTREAARVRLLACHCAIHRYRWEYDRPPPNLSVLKLGALAVDPFTGHTLHYAIHGTGYTLSSAGPVATADDPNAVNGRRPVSLAPED